MCDCKPDELQSRICPVQLHFFRSCHEGRIMFCVEWDWRKKRIRLIWVVNVQEDLRTAEFCKKSLYLFCYCCGSQNRNRFILDLFVYMYRNLQLDWIEIKFLEKDIKERIETANISAQTISQRLAWMQTSQDGVKEGCKKILGVHLKQRRF